MSANPQTRVTRANLRFCLFGGLLFLLAFVALNRDRLASWRMRREQTAIARAAGNPQFPVMLPQAWRSIGRASVLNQSFAVQDVQGWYVKGIPVVRGIQTRYTLRGRFAANDPVAFVVVDPQNVQRIQEGNPPLIQYVVLEGKEVSVPWPATGSFYGFVRPRQDVSQNFPLTLSELALQLIARVAQSSRPPAKVTAELWVDGECFCTQADASRLFHR